MLCIFRVFGGVGAIVALIFLVIALLRNLIALVGLLLVGIGPSPFLVGDRDREVVPL